MAGMYTDAKDWLEQNAREGGISLDQIISFVLCEVSNDDIERYFGVNMEDDSDNPGAGMKYCENCQRDVDESDWDEEADMCSECAAELAEEDEEEEEPRVYAWEDDRYIEDPLAWRMTKEANGNTIWLRDSDCDYDPADDHDYPPFDTTVYEPYHGNAPTAGEFSIWRQGFKLCAVRVDPVVYHRYIVDDEHGVAWIRNNYINPVIVYTQHR